MYLRPPAYLVFGGNWERILDGVERRIEVKSFARFADRGGSGGLPSSLQSHYHQAHQTEDDDEGEQDDDGHQAGPRGGERERGGRERWCGLSRKRCGELSWLPLWPPIKSKIGKH